REALDALPRRRSGPKVDRAEQFGEMSRLQAEGKVRALGLSEVSVEQIQQAQQYFTVSTVQNRYSLDERKWEDVLQYCTENQIAFIPWAPLAGGRLTEPGGAVDAAARRLRATHAQVALAWLLQHSPMMLPIPRTSAAAEVRDNLGAADLQLDGQAVAELNAAG